MPIFDSKSIRQAVEKTLEDSSVGKDKNAFVVVVTKDGVKGVLSTKVGKNWEVTEYFSIDHSKRIDGGIEVKATW